MRILSLLLFYALLFFPNRQTDSPHGPGFKISCSTCHSSKGWQLDKSIYSFDHNTTRLPLTGQHKEINCRQCHLSLVFKEAKSECVQCHADVHQSTVGSDCSRCHTPASWLVNNINDLHQMSRFPLIGVHRTADCNQCHKSESQTRFDVPGINCIDCHRQNFMAATNPNHVEAGFSEDCITCHPVISSHWEGAKYNHNFFPLVQGHSMPKCADCHTSGNYTNAKADCFSCHEKDFLASTNPDHNASGISKTCTDCHTLNPGWKPTTFNHNIFPLTLGHASPKCSDCHLGGNYATTPIDCYSCHKQDYLATANPNHSTSAFSTTCTDCHTTNPGWKPTTFNHSQFPLTLGHSLPACVDCHKGNYTSTPADCYSCHQQDFLATADPNHSASGFSITCTDCHTTNPGWRPVNFSHNQFPLTLGHSVPKCSDCHKGNYTAIPADCYSCHQQDFLSTTDPNHSVSGFSITCTDCHTTNPGWKPTTFNHSQFPLTLGHSVPTCGDCHKGNYTAIPADCYSCHQQDFLSTTDPNHSVSGFSITCTDCHTTNPGWKPTTFNHTIFPLTLGHSVPSCSDCHKGNYTSTSSDCYSCHQKDFLATTDPNHSTSGFSTTCTDCHTTNPGWKPTTFNHTGFPLTSGHSVPSCSDCHKGNYTSTSADCYSCHQKDFLATTDPNHSVSGFSTTCTDCHTTNPGWKPTTFNHTGFPLTLGHSIPTCGDCHKGNYISTSADCYSCHQKDFLATTDPNHSTSGFSTTCTDCHTTNPGWKPTTFNHTIFPLTLGHSVPSCSDCHKGNYTSTSADCYSCHQKDFLATTNPDHNASGFSTTCTDCHTTNPGWKPTTFNHTIFPLTLGHSVPSCSDCHKGNYTSTSADCFSCHQANYNGTVNPNHKSLGFSTTCNTCHTTNPGWKPASYLQHDSQFPIYSGRHRGQWSTCADCHTNASNYALFSCIVCHEHNKTEMDNKHIGEVNGYSYLSSECYRCHPTGNAGGR